MFHCIAISTSPSSVVPVSIEMISIDRLLALGEVLHEVDEPAVGLEDCSCLRRLALVDEPDLDALVEERQLVQPLGERLALELQRLDEDLGVGPEPHPGSGLRGGLALLERPRDACPRSYDWVHERPSRMTSTSSFSLSALTTETPTPCRPPEIAYPPPPNLPPACSTVSTTSTAGRRSFAPGIGLTGMPRPLSKHAHRPIVVDRDDDLVGEPSHGLVDGVVDDLVDEVVQTASAGGADVHAGALADRFEPLEDLDVAGVVCGCALLGSGCQRASVRCCVRPRDEPTQNPTRGAGGVRGKVARTDHHLTAADRPPTGAGSRKTPIYLGFRTTTRT